MNGESGHRGTGVPILLPSRAASSRRHATLLDQAPRGAQSPGTSLPFALARPRTLCCQPRPRSGPQHATVVWAAPAVASILGASQTYLSDPICGDAGSPGCGSGPGTGGARHGRAPRQGRSSVEHAQRGGRHAIVSVARVLANPPPARALRGGSVRLTEWTGPRLR